MADVTKEQAVALEMLVDDTSLVAVLTALAEICSGKAKLADAREKIERLRARLENCEASLYHYDDTYTSEYWLRHQRMIDWNVRATAGEAADSGDTEPQA
jgi:hypothetical protein